jgi:DNA transformation protein and related proteins
MTADSKHYIEFVLEQLAPLRDVASKSFFGGTGFVSGDTQFAMVMGSVLYFVVDDATRPSYEKMGGGCFSYATKKGRVDVRKYFSVPAELIENQERLVVLARESICVASAAKRGSKSRTKLKIERKKTR